MTANFSNVSKYQQTNQIWKNNQTTKSEKNGADNSIDAKGNALDDVKVKEWKPVNTSSPLVPTTKEGYGTVIGDVKLSEDAQKYYNTLKSKFGNMDFILVSKDMKKQVEANASLYGNAFKPVVLIDDEKIERMATDEAYRKKYEGILAMAQMKLDQAKNSLVSSGANVKNFGLSVNEDGKMSFFATIEKANDAQNKLIEKRQEAKKEEKAKEKKKAAKEAREESIEKLREKNKADKIAKDDKNDDDVINEDKEYIEFKSNDIDALLNKVSKYVYDHSFSSVKTDAEAMVGQSIDFRG
ncbi:MAG: hypothetical protein KBS96_01700 [Lachnospiraceae bacterium]|nr:hypothetical protein [Candidatus Colinaster scatohippi]